MYSVIGSSAWMTQPHHIGGSLIAGWFVAECSCQLGCGHSQIFAVVKFTAGWAVPVLFLLFGVLAFTFLDMLEEFCRGILFAANLATFECMPAYNFIPYQDAADIAVVFISNRAGRAKIGTGQTADAVAGSRRGDEITTIDFTEFQGLGANDFSTHAHTESTSNTAVGHASRKQSKFLADFMDGFGMGG